jgi:ligand-binding SRPBCC domain-containing protein
MPRFIVSAELPVPVARAFDFCSKPANLLSVTPPGLQLAIQNAPEKLALGTQLTLVSRRWGLRYRSVVEVVVFDPNRCFVEQQREGAFGNWRHAHRFEERPNGTSQLIDEIEYEPPGGMLGLMVTPTVVERELGDYFRYRNEKLAAILAAPHQASVAPSP